MRSLTALAALLLPGAALAVTGADVQELGRQADELGTVARDIEQRVGTGGNTDLTEDEAKARFEKYLFYRLVGRHQEAAEGFFGLVTTGALTDADLHRDAEWHLAESLYGMGNVVTAEARFKVIAQDQYHPFRADAVRQLLELYADEGDYETFYQLYEAEIVNGRVKPTSEITYTIAKSFYKQGDMAKSSQYFNDILPEHPEFSRARYFLGVLALREDKLEEAVPYFQEASQVSIETVDGRRVHDLSLLALARIAYENSDFLTAADNYQKVGGDSEYLDDVLFESSWSWIKQDRYDEALQSVGIFLLAYPEHRYAGDLRVIEGHLHMGCAQSPDKCPDPSLKIEQGDPYQAALTTYQSIVEDYSPIQEKFEELAASEEAAFAHFQTTLRPNALEEEGMPQFALAMMRDDPDLDKALTVAERLSDQRADLDACDEMIAAIQRVLSSDNGAGGFEGARFEAIANQARVASRQIDLMTLHVNWLKENGVDTSLVQSRLSQLQGKQSAIEKRASDATSQRDAHLAKVEALASNVANLTTGNEAARTALDELKKQLQEARYNRDKRRIQGQIDEQEEILGTNAQELEKLNQELTDLQMPTDAMGGDTSIGEVSDTVKVLNQDLVQLRPKKAELGDDFDSVYSRLERLQFKYEDVLKRLDRLADTDLGKIRERFEAEVAQVRAERTDLEDNQKKNDDLAAKVAKDGLSRMESFFRDSVMKAETGIIDVYWSRKLELAEQREQIQSERNDVVEELERRFRLIRQKMEQ